MRWSARRDTTPASHIRDKTRCDLGGKPASARPLQARIRGLVEERSATVAEGSASGLVEEPSATIALLALC